MSLAPFIHAMGRGPGRARNLTGDEAAAAMRLILRGDADPHGVGALLMLMRYRGETSAEIAGFAHALRATLPALPPVGLDWPSFAAGRTRGLPWFLLSARLIAQTGVRVLVHGWSPARPDGADVRAALALCGIAQAGSLPALTAVLDRDGIAYLPLEVLHPRALELLRLREVFGLRSCVNTVLRVSNPAGAPAAVQGVFHPPYRALQQGAGEVLGQPQLCVLKGGGGEFERNPTKATEVFRLQDGAACRTTLPPLLPEARRLTDAAHPPAALAALWAGTLRDPFAEAIVTGTAAAALIALGHASQAADETARTLWAGRFAGGGM